MSATRRSYTIREKIDVINKVRNMYANNLSKASRELGIDRKCLRQWLQQEEKLNALTLEQQDLRKQAAGRKFKFPQVEDLLLQWVHNEQINSTDNINYKRIREKAEEIAKRLNINTLVANNKWIFNFCQRHNLVTRRVRRVKRKNADAQVLAFEHLQVLMETPEDEELDKVKDDSNEEKSYPDVRKRREKNR
ncbi:pogo transposable element with KRAB domain-like protein [Dinothrombium tinctorium]|uniref:Pogo transposable element with KRAB domain-like protein n=1 Tax=Dinothrombium tinctorium TaxID=1965070 RepID=A0A443RC02_9ACAR|nr:pogo transposable element with KRAB domain-like protein [Dinothrombium tinctorium]